MKTDDVGYRDRLVRIESSWWRRLIDPQIPYRWNLRRLSPGFTLDIGCGLGRNLAHIDGHGVGLDHNPHSVATARARGLVAMTPDEFQKSEYCKPERFDSLLAAHLAEHMNPEEFVALIRPYLRHVKKGGRLILITPQEAGYRSDPTHVRFVDFELAARIGELLGLKCERQYSFPFPRAAGRLFRHNEFITLLRLP